MTTSTSTINTKYLKKNTNVKWMRSGITISPEISLLWKKEAIVAQVGVLIIGGVTAQLIKGDRVLKNF